MTQEQADKANYYKNVDPYSDLSRGFDAGYKERAKEEIEGRISDAELLSEFDKELRQPNLLIASAEACVRIAKEYANNLNNK